MDTHGWRGGYRLRKSFFSKFFFVNIFFNFNFFYGQRITGKKLIFVCKVDSEVSSFRPVWVHCIQQSLLLATNNFLQSEDVNLKYFILWILSLKNYSLKYLKHRIQIYKIRVWGDLSVSSFQSLQKLTIQHKTVESFYISQSLNWCGQTENGKKFLTLITLNLKLTRTLQF